MGFLLIKQGLQDRVLVGGAQEVNYYSMATFDALGAFSKRMEEPLKASRPFDRDRDGLIPSGGAAALVLEDYESAVKRGATILAEVVGYGFSSNGGGISQPSDDGSFIAMERALKMADMTADDVDYVIPGNDDAIRAVKLIVSKLADAVIEAQEGAAGEDVAAEEAEGAVEEVAEAAETAEDAE